MDADLKKSLKEMAYAIQKLAHESRSEVEASPSVTTEGRITKLESAVGWHFRVGLGIATLLGLGLLGLMTWYIPHEQASLRDAIKVDTASQVEPLREQLARISGLMELRQSKNVTETLKNNVNFAQPRAALVAVRAVVQEASAERLQVDPAVLSALNVDIQRSVRSDEGLAREAWAAQVALVTYRTVLPYQPKQRVETQPVFSFSGNTIQDVQISSAGQKLDGIYWRNVTFTNMNIEYDGGLVLLENVRFVNCTFKMPYSRRTDQFAGLVLSRESVTGSLA